MTAFATWIGKALTLTLRLKIIRPFLRSIRKSRKILSTLSSPSQRSNFTSTISWASTSRVPAVGCSPTIRPTLSNWFKNNTTLVSLFFLSLLSYLILNCSNSYFSKTEVDKNFYSYYRLFTFMFYDSICFIIISENYIFYRDERHCHWCC